MASGETDTMTDWVQVTAVGLVSSIASWLVSWRIATERQAVKSDAVATRLADHEAAQADTDESLRGELHEFRNDWKAGMTELRSVAASIGQLQASQDVVNKVTAKALEGISERLDKHDDKLSDHGATIKLLTELVTRKGGGQ